MAVDDGHNGLLRVVPGTDAAADAIHLALADEGVHCLDLDREELLDGSLDLGLGCIDGHVENDLVVFRSHRRLFSHDGVTDDIVSGKLVHANLASSASSAALVRTSLSRLRIETTLIPCTGSTSIFGMLRAARAKFWSTVAPSMIRAFAQASLPKVVRRAAVLASACATLSSTISEPAAALADRACLSARARTFLGRSIAWLRGVGPNARPPPRNWGALRSPWRAPPEPFCFTNFLPVRTPSERCLTSCVPAIAFSCW